MSVFTDQITVTNTPLPIDGGNTNAVKTDGSAVIQPVSGTVTANAGTGTFTVDGSAVTQPVSVAGSVAVTGPLTDTQLRATPVPVSGSLSTSPVTSNSATVTQVTSTGSNQTILAANTNRKKCILSFVSGTWYIKFGATASNSNYTYLVNSNNTVIEITIWTGQIDILNTSSGKLVNVTELV